MAGELTLNHDAPSDAASWSSRPWRASSASRTSPTVSCTRVGSLEEHQNQIQSRSLGGSGWISTASPSHTSYMAGQLPPRHSGPAHPSRSCSHSQSHTHLHPQTILGNGIRYVYTDEASKQTASSGPHAPDLHVHLRPLTTPSLKTPSPDPNLSPTPTIQPPPLYDTSQTAPYISLPLSTY